MKKRKENVSDRITHFFRNFSRTQIRSAVIAVCGVFLLVLVFALILRLRAPKNPDDGLISEDSSVSGNDNLPIQQASFFEDSAYPAKISMKGSGLLVELDGSQTPDLQWEIECNQNDIVTIAPEGKENGGKLQFQVSPVTAGYAVMNCTRTIQIGEKIYPAAEIRLEVVVSAVSGGGLETAVTDVRQYISVLGAKDSAQPFLIIGDSVFFPSGGDWTVEAEETAHDYYRILSDTDDSGAWCAQVITMPNVLSLLSPEMQEEAFASHIILKSESLGVSYQLEILYDENNRMYLQITEEA